MKLPSLKFVPVVALTFTASFGLCLSALADHGENFHCDFNSFAHPDAAAALKKIAGNNRGLLRIVQAYTLKWEDAEIERICVSAAAGNHENFGCMGGRQDWTVIRKSIPPEFFSMSAKKLRPHYLALQKAEADNRPRTKVLDLCGKLNVVDRSFK